MLRRRKRRTDFRPRIAVDPTVLGPVNRMVFGQNAEWTHFTDYPSVWGEGPRLRKSLIEAIKQMGVTSMRYPGGCHGDYYHWEWGAGPFRQRPTVLNPFTGKQMEHRFGTDEFLELCYQAQAMPWIQTNPVSAGSQETLEWLLYCRSKGASVFYWELGNEIYMADRGNHSPTEANGARIAMTAADYAQRAGEHLRAIRDQIPDSVVGAIGGVYPPHGWYGIAPLAEQWNETVLRELGSEIDFLAIHTAYAPLCFADDLTDPDALRAAFVAAGAAPHGFRQNIAANLDLVDSLAPRREISLAVTEWLPWFGITGQAPVLGGAMGAGIYTAGMLNLLMREPRVMAAHFMSFLQPYFGAAIRLTPDGFEPSVNHAIFSLYNAHLGEERLATQVTSDLYGVEPMGVVAEMTRVPAIDAIATLQPDERLEIIVVNRDLERGRTLDIELEHFDLRPAGTEIVTSGHWLDANGPDSELLRRPPEPITVRPGPKLVPTIERAWEIDLPPCSVVAMRFVPAGRPAGSQDHPAGQ